ncbi:hypothetical protein D623_10022276 [Myotis brandtii]|uniref:Uncharacterized protein n=1 Tax=Myotis brandtii TaxID=109478 RepID=S7Q807_MYOBR|nr:hypothetical protein D623_10022276 [Myotis brandtii]
MPNSVRISEEKPKAPGRGGRGRGSRRQLPSSLEEKKKKHRTHTHTQKKQFAKGRKSASRLLPRKCPGTEGEFCSCFVPFCVCESPTRLLPPPLERPRLSEPEWQVGSSRSLAANRKPASLPKVVVAAGGSSSSLTLRRRRQ